jgi:hypothetical protein
VARVSLGEVWAARGFLAWLGEHVGVVAAGAAPGLVALVDQHSAAVRDIVEYGVEGAGAVAAVVLLAGYAKGVLDQAQAGGWRFEQTTDWVTMRLVGVCELGKRLDT